LKYGNFLPKNAQILVNFGHFLGKNSHIPKNLQNIKKVVDESLCHPLVEVWTKF